MSRFRNLVRFGAAFLVSTAASEAWGQQPAGRVLLSLDYEAPAKCPSRLEIAERISQRSDRVSVTDGVGDFHVRVRITGTAGKAIAHLELTRGSDTKVRSTPVSACEDAMDAIALIIVLAVDPRASLTPRPPQPATGKSRGARVARASRHAGAKPQQVPLAVDRGRRPSPPLVGEEMGIAPEISILGGVGPRPLVAGGLAGRWTLEAASGLNPTLHVAALRSLSQDVATPAGTANLRWTGVAGHICPARLHWESLAALLCATADVGVVEAVGRDTPNPEGVSRWWFAPGVGLGFEWRPSPGVLAHSGIRASVPVLRDRYFLRPDETVHRPPVATAAANLGVGARF